jgi:hypothetical protein
MNYLFSFFGRGSTPDPAVTKKIVRTYKDISKLAETFNVTLIDDHIDYWEVTFLYPNNCKIVLRFQ